MIKKKRLLGWCAILELYYESADVVHKLITNTKHLSGRVYSYEPIVFDRRYKLSRTKETTRLQLKNTDSEQLLQSFKKNYRNEIRKTFSSSQFESRLVQGLSDEGHQLYRDFELQSQRTPISAKDASGLWWLGYVDGKLVSGVYVLDAQPVLKIVAIFSKRKDSTAHTSAIGYISKRLIYDIGCYGIENKYYWVDLAYINRLDPDKAGITTYKLGFGGDIAHEYLYEADTILVRTLKKCKKLLS